MMEPAPVVQAVTVNELRYAYGKDQGAPETLKGIDLAIRRGSLCAVVGPNGSGKSTLLKLISGYLKPSTGSVSVMGQDPSSIPSSVRAGIVTYTGDEPDPVFDFTVEETVAMGRTARRSSAGQAPFFGVAEAMREAGVLSMRRRRITSLSSGERQRVYIARALCQDPAVLLLDEPTAHLDMGSELEIMDLACREAGEKGKTVVTVVHDINLALRYAERLFFLKDGAVKYAIEPKEVTPEIILEVYGVRAYVERNRAVGCPVVVPVAPTVSPAQVFDAFPAPSNIR